MIYIFLNLVSSLFDLATYFILVENVFLYFIYLFIYLPYLLFFPPSCVVYLFLCTASLLLTVLVSNRVILHPQIVDNRRCFTL